MKSKLLDIGVVLACIGVIVAFIFPPTFDRGSGQFRPMHNLANNYLRLGQIDEALATEIEAVKLPDHSNVRIRYLGFALMGEVFFIKGDYAQAVKNLQKALVLNPRFPIAYNRLARIYAIHGQRDNATEVLKVGISLNPNDQEMKDLLEMVVRNT